MRPDQFSLAQPTNVLKRRLAAICLLIALVTSAAQGAAPTIGLSIIPFTGDWPHAMLSSHIPFHTYESNVGPVDFGVRVDVSAPLNLSELPRFGVGATAAWSSNDMLQPFFGAGAEALWRGAQGERTFYVTPTLIVGLRVPLDPTWSVRIDAIVAPLDRRVSFGFGVDIALR